MRLSLLLGRPGGERGHEGLLGHVHPPDRLHPLLALLLLLQKLALAGDVAAVALGQNVLSHRLDRLASDDPAADGGLDGDLELLAGNELLELLRHLQPVGVRLVFVNDRGEGVDDLVVEQQVDLDEVGLLVLGHVVVEGGVSLRPALELVEEVGDDLRQWKSIVQFDPLRREVVHPQHGAAPLLAQLHDRPRVVGGGEHRGAHGRLEDQLELALGELRRIGDDRLLAAVGHHPVDDRRRCGDDVDAELPLEPLPDDLQVEQPQEPASEAEAEGDGVLGLV